MMSSGDADYLSIEENVQLFLDNILDQVVIGANEYESEDIRNVVEEILENVTAKVDWVVRERELGAVCRKVIRTSIDVVIRTSIDVQRNNNAYSKREPRELVVISGEKNTTIKKSEAYERKIANELKGKAFPNFHKLQDVKMKNGKVKVLYCEDLSKEEQGRLQREAEELFKRIGEAEIQKMNQRREAEGGKKGIGARISRFFRKFSCCRSCTDV